MPVEGAHTEPCFIKTEPSLIETMRLENGRVALWPWHRARLLSSAATLGYAVDENELDAQLGTAIGAQVATVPDSAPDATAYRLRLLLARDGAICIRASVQPTTQEPVRIVLAQELLDSAEPLLRHKTTYRPWFEGASQWLHAHPEVFDVIFFSTSGALCEGSRCNIYVLDGSGQWLTPFVASGLLPGVGRQFLLDGGLVQEANLSAADIKNASALRVSNALRGWLNAEVVSGK